MQTAMDIEKDGELSEREFIVSFHSVMRERLSHYLVVQ